MIISDFLSKALRRQAAQSDFLPKISQHVTPNIFHYRDGYLGFVIRCEGIPFESESESQIYARFHQLALLLAGLGKTLGNRLGLWTTLQRKKRRFDRHYQFENLFCQQFAQKYLQRFESGQFFDTFFYLSCVLKYEEFEDGIKEAEELIDTLRSGLQAYDPYVLSAYQNEVGVVFSEAFEFIGSLVNYEYSPVPLSAIDIAETLGQADLHFGSDMLEIRAPNVTKYATAFDLKDFGISRPKVLVGILELPFEFTLTQSFVYIQNYEIQQLINKQLNNLQSVGDQAHQQHSELMEGKGAITAGELMFGDYHAALVVYGDTPKEASNYGAMAYTRFLDTGGFGFKKAGFSAPITYFSQVPGAKKKPRNVPKTTVNLATTFGMHTYSHGKTQGNPIGDGSAVIPLQTVSNGIYDFNFHFSNPKEDNLGESLAGHTLILGATGTGKTTLETTLLSFAQRFDPYLFAMDLDAGLQIFIQAIGGSYFALQAGTPTGLNPFQLPDTVETRELLYQLVGVCGQNEYGRLTDEEEKQIKVAVDTLLTSIDFEHRNFSTLLESIPFSVGDNSLRIRLAKWCRSENGRYAWCLDNPVNQFNPTEFYKIGFDLTDILKEGYAPTEPILLYLFYLRSLMLKNVAKSGGIMVTVVEEFWWPIRFNATKELILKILKTDRKLGGWIILTSQSPEDAIASDIFSAIVQQTPTKIFLPNPDAKYEEGYELCGLTQKEYEELVKLSLDSRQFLIKQSKQSAFAKLDLRGFTEEMAVLSGDSANSALLEELLAQNPSATPNEWYPLFREQIRAKQQSKLLH
ncbi:VirB4 family type IV secretion/conjugal transfer ATPase [Paenalcaligenes hermetiae]|uniref:VirB4 family type IV secretion/conjugal transfer ATPase n=1 Tax=Paenalcaligenes hermetiae TaxID=1157987 RepID=A0ABP9M9D0_9BURK